MCARETQRHIYVYIYAPGGTIVVGIARAFAHNALPHLCVCVRERERERERVKERER